MSNQPAPEVTEAPAPVAPPAPAAYPPQAPPYPGQPNAPYAQPIENPGQTLGIIGLVLNFIGISIGGIILGIIYLTKSDKDAKKFGMICLILGILGPIIWAIIWWILAASIFTAAVSTIPYY